MPYGRRFFKRRFGGRYRKRYGRMGRRGRFAGRLHRVVRRVKQLTDCLYNYRTSGQYTGSSSGQFVSSHAQLPTGTSNAMVHLSEIPAGAGEGARLGNRCQLRRLWIRGYTVNYVAYDPATVGEYPLGRILIWMVKDNNGQGLSTSGSNTDTSTILTNQGVGNAILPPLDPDFWKKVKILADIHLNLSNVSVQHATSGANNHGRVVRWERNINLKKHMDYTTFTGSSGTMAESERNHVFICFLQQVAPTLAGSMVSVWQHRLSFDP